MTKHIIKFGGSVITDFSSEHHFNQDNTERLAKEVLPFNKENCVLVHGTGQVGKPAAIEYGFLESGIISSTEYLTALKIRNEIRQLNQKFIEVFLEESIPVISISIEQFYDWEEDDFDLPALTTEIEQLMEKNLIPVFHGDLLARSDGSFKVFSSDLITFLLSKALTPQNVFFLSDVKGVYVDKDKMTMESEILDVLNNKTINTLKKSGSDEQDVSGGMQAKARIAVEIAKYCECCFIGNGYVPGVLTNLLSGTKVEGTYVEAE